MYVRISRRKKSNKIYVYYQLTQSYRVGTTIRKKIICSLPEQLALSLTQGLLKNKDPKLYALPTSIYAVCQNDLELSTLFKNIFSPSILKKEVATLTILMIIHRIINPDSKLSLTRWYKNIMLPVSLPEKLDVHDLYYTLDYLLNKKEEIEKQLYRVLQEKQLIKTTVVFYDLTSSYFEGEDVEMAAYGYSRDHRPDRPQITLGLVIDSNGLPIFHEVFAGNMSDGKTVKGILEKLKELFQITDVIFVADKGMLTKDNLQVLVKERYQSILSESVRNALSPKQREEHFLQKESFTKLKDMEDSLWYKETEDKTGANIIVCYNQYTAVKAKQTRMEKIKKLELFITETKTKHKKAKELELRKVRDMILAKLVKSHARKYFDTKDQSIISNFFPLKQNIVKQEEYMDGMWIIRSSAKNLTTEELINTYKNLKTIEASFRVIKDVIELRPIYHHKDDRVKGHVFICVLAFLVTKLLEQKTGQTIKMLREEHAASVAFTLRDGITDSPLILGGNDLLQAVL